MFRKAIPNAAVKSDGVTLVDYVPGVGYALGVGTWYVDASMPDPSTVTIHCMWDTNLIATSIKYQSSNAPAFKSISQPYTDNAAPPDVTAFAAPGSGWISRTLAAAPDVAGTGATSSTAGFVLAGGGAGGGIISLPNNGDGRGRIEIVVTTPGIYRQYVHGKQA